MGITIFINFFKSQFSKCIYSNCLESANVHCENLMMYNKLMFILSWTSFFILEYKFEYYPDKTNLVGYIFLGCKIQKYCLSICSQVSFSVHMVRSASSDGRCVTVWLSVRIDPMKSTASSRTRAVVIAVIKTAASQNPLSVMETQTVRTAATRKAVVGGLNFGLKCSITGFLTRTKCEIIWFRM